MKKLLLPVMLLTLLFTTAEIKANVYASGIRISDATVTEYNLAGNTWDGNFLDGTGVKIWFIINEAGGGALTATVQVYSGATLIKTINAAVPVKGINSVIWDGYKNDMQPASAGSYTFKVTVADPVGHTAFDSLWVTSAYYQGPDPDGATSYAYRGNASSMDATSPAFGSLFVSRGSTTATFKNGFYKYRADGVFIAKVDTVPEYPASVPNEITTVGNKVYGLAGYGYTGAGFSLGFDAITNTFTDSLIWKNSSVRGFASYKVGDVVSFYTGKSGTINPVVLKITGTDTPIVAADLSSLITGTNSYIKAVDLDDSRNIYAAFGNASASRKKLAKFNEAGTLLWVDSLEAHGFAAAAYFQAVAIDRGDPLTVADDIIYALIYPGGSTYLAQWGIYKISLDGTTYTQLVSPAGMSSAATSTIINVDAAGNVCWSNGSIQERIIMFSPADGPNSYTTVSPMGYNVVVTVPIPVELAGFSASVSGNDVVLNWTTATETNNKGFEVEKNSGSGWNVIGFVAGNGTSTQTINYQFVDKNVSGEVTYRLKQIDFNGSFTYSNEVKVNAEIPKGYELSQNYPNPFNPVTNIQFSLPVDSRIRLEIYNMAGELITVLADDFRTAGSHLVSFDASDLSSGTYIYRLTAGTTVLTRKMVLMK